MGDGIVVLFEVRAQFAGDHEEKHAEVTDKRPHRVTEGGRCIFLDQEVTGPSEGIGDHGEEQNVPIVACDNCGHNHSQTEHGATKVHDAVGGVTVGPDVVGEERSVIGKTRVVGHGMPLCDGTVKYFFQ